MNNIAIIGGGASGFFAAIRAKELNPQLNITIFEKGKTALAKVLITGGGRCNLTNTFNEVDDLKQAYPRGEKLLKRLFNHFNYQDTVKWFENNGVKLITQEDQRLFPASQDAKTIVDCLQRKAQRLNINIAYNHHFLSIEQTTENRLKVCFQTQESRIFDAVLLAMGGVPHIAKLAFLSCSGHKIVPPVPSLFTFNINNKNLLNLMGVSVPIVSLRIVGTKIESKGSLLITHWGISGPATLKLSSYGAIVAKENNYKFQVSINWINESNASKVEEYLLEIFAMNKKKQLSSLHIYHLTQRVWSYLVERSGIELTKRCEEIGKKNLNKLIETLTNDIYNVEGKGAFKDEFVTCGGVSLKSVNPQTLESKHIPNLYFSGEMLDIDAITGGFNLQAAWTTGFVTGTALSKK